MMLFSVIYCMRLGILIEICTIKPAHHMYNAMKCALKKSVYWGARGVKNEIYQNARTWK